MAYNLQNSINYASTFIQYAPLTAGTGLEPATSIATSIRNAILSAPFAWPWNRAEFVLQGPTALQANIPNYVFGSLSDFAYLEKVHLLTADFSYGFEIKDVYNRDVLGIAASKDVAQPNAVSVTSYIPGVSLSLRFLPSPDQAYTGVLSYQQLVLPFNYQFNLLASGNAVGPNTTYVGSFNPSYFQIGGSAVIAGFPNSNNNGTFPIVSCTTTNLIVTNPNGVAQVNAATATNNGAWAPIPDSFINIFNPLFLAEAMAFVDDARATLYRQRGVAALLAKAEGLSSMQINAFLAQWQMRDISQMMRDQLRVQQASQARGV